jgi:hypothetical protein
MMPTHERDPHKPKCKGHLCSIRFRANMGTDEHSCPYQEIVNNNADYRCHCCSACEQNCRDDT